MITPDGVHAFVVLFDTLWLLWCHKYELIRLKRRHIRRLHLLRIEIGCFHSGYLIMSMIYKRLLLWTGELTDWLAEDLVSADIVQFLGGWDRIWVKVKLGCRWGLEDLNIGIDDVPVPIEVDGWVEAHVAIITIQVLVWERDWLDVITLLLKEPRLYWRHHIWLRAGEGNLWTLLIWWGEQARLLILYQVQWGSPILLSFLTHPLLLRNANLEWWGRVARKQHRTLEFVEI